MIFTDNYLQEEISRTEELITQLGQGQNETILLDILLSNGNKEKAMAESFIWRQEDNRDIESDLLEGRLEGADLIGASEPTTRKKLSNNCQIFSRSASITGTAMALNPLGIKDHLAKEMEAQMVLLKRGLNKCLIEGTIQDEDRESRKARKMNGLLNFIDIVEDAGGNALTAEHIENAMERMWREGNGGDKLCLVNASVKKKLNKIYADVPEATLQIQAGNNTFGVLATSVITDFGTIHIVLDRCMPVDQVVIVRPSELVLETLRPFEVIQDPKTFDGIKKTIIGEYGLKVRNTKAHAKILNFK